MKVRNELFFPMSKFGLAIIFAVANLWGMAQVQYSDSLVRILAAQDDTLKVKTLLNVAARYAEQTKKDTALAYYLEALKIAEESKNEESLYMSLFSLADFYQDLRKQDLALEFALKANKIAEKQGNKEKLFTVADLIGGYIYFNQGKYDLALEYGLELQKIAGELKDESKIGYAEMYIGDVYRAQNKFDSAINLYSKALQRWATLNDSDRIRTSLNNIGVIYDAQDNYQMANSFYLRALQVAERQGYRDMAGKYSFAISTAYLAQKKCDQALLYADKSRNLYDSTRNISGTIKAYFLLSEIYAAKEDYKNSYSFLSLHRRLKDSIAFTSGERNMNSLQAKYESDKVERQIDVMKREGAIQAKLRNLFIAVSGLLIVIAVLIANRYRAKKKSEDLLNTKNVALTQTLAELKATQAQLIQSAKMASLGELTAGIAHEIQNPLNFITNFSEINNELLQEMNEEIQKENFDDVKTIAKNVIDNQAKINHHGKRAAGIVKGMLQHSRSSTGHKEPTDINKLADEYFRLAYHGLRAKDKSFNAILKTDFDESVGNLSIIPQDIGRVLLNLYNNAFYAVTEKAKQQANEYEPVVSLNTKKIGEKMELRISDNGNGIPQQVLDKIFQPFFTTKPTGQGTGLGLSLSYDIIKSHGGELKVETKEREGAVFVIQLPLNEII